MVPLKLLALKQIPETTQLDRFLLESFTFDQVMTMIEQNISNLSVFDRFASALNWRHICQTMTMSETMMRLFDLYLDWEAVSEYQHLSEDFIKFYASRLNWNNICQFQQLSFEIVQDYVFNADNLDVFFSQPQLQWSDEQFGKFLQTAFYNLGDDLTDYGHAICKTQFISEHYIRNNVDLFNWDGLAEAQRTWSDEFLQDFLLRFDTDSLQQYARLTEAQIMTLPQNWHALSLYQVLSPEFITSHARRVIWHRIACNQILSDELIGRIQRMTDWTNEAKREFSAFLTDWTKIAQFPLLCDWATLSAREDMSESILIENEARVRWDLVSVPNPTDVFLTLYSQRLPPQYVTEHASEKFLLSHPQFITRHVQLNARIISMSFFNKYFDLFGAHHLVHARCLSSHFIDKHWDKFTHYELLYHQNLNREQRVRITFAQSYLNSSSGP